MEYATADLASGDGVAPAVAGIETIVHLAGEQKGDDVKAERLVEAAAPAGVRHVVYISVVGDDRVPMAGAIDRAMFGYFGSKHAASEVIACSGIPWTTLRATQFFDLTLATASALAKLPIVPLPSGFRFQPVDAGEVATRLVELAAGAPQGHVPDLGGPRIYTMNGLLRSYLRATGKRRPIVQVRAPARRPLRSGRGRTSPRTGRSAGGPGRSSSRSGSDRLPGAGRRRRPAL